MSIKPVDMQVLLPRSQEIQKGEMVKDSKPNIESQLVLADNTKETFKNSTQVIKTKQGDLNNVKLKDEEKKEQKKDKYNLNKRQKQKSDADIIEPPNLGNKIDIKI